jgi:DNA-binding response OmpR family regulator
MFKILLADDEPNILMSLDFLMRKEGYHVFIARNGKEALEIAFKNLPDAIVLDIMMPELDGYEVCKQIRQSEDLANVKIVFLSAKSKETDFEKGYQMGADLYLTKPFSTKNLVTKIKELLTTVV